MSDPLRRSMSNLNYKRLKKYKESYESVDSLKYTLVLEIENILCSIKY